MNTSKLTRTARGTENFVNHGQRTSKAENASGSLSTPTLSMELQRMSSFGHNYSIRGKMALSQTLSMGLQRNCSLTHQYYDIVLIQCVQFLLLFLTFFCKIV